MRELLDQRDQLDQELADMVAGDINPSVRKTRKAQACSICGDPHHNARNCPVKPHDANGQTPTLPT